MKNPQRQPRHHAHAPGARDHDAEFRRAGAEGPGPDVELGGCGERWVGVRGGGRRRRGRRRRRRGKGVAVRDQRERLAEGVDVVEE